MSRLFFFFKFKVVYLLRLVSQCKVISEQNQNPSGLQDAWPLLCLNLHSNPANHNEAWQWIYLVLLSSVVSRALVRLWYALNSFIHSHTLIC